MVSPTCAFYGYCVWERSTDRTQGTEEPVVPLLRVGLYIPLIATGPITNESQYRMRSIYLLVGW